MAFHPHHTEFIAWIPMRLSSSIWTERGQAHNRNLSRTRRPIHSDLITIFGVEGFTKWHLWDLGLWLARCTTNEGSPKADTRLV